MAALFRGKLDEYADLAQILPPEAIQGFRARCVAQVAYRGNAKDFAAFIQELAAVTRHDSPEGWTVYLKELSGDPSLADATLRSTAQSLASAHMLRGIRATLSERLRALQGVSPTLACDVGTFIVDTEE